MLDDDVKNRLFITINGKEIQLDYSIYGLSIDSSENEIMERVVPIVEEREGINISDTYKVRKSIDTGNIFVFPNSTAG